MRWGLTIPLEYVSDFEAGTPVKSGSSREIIIVWGRKKYTAKLCHTRSTRPVYQIRWEKNRQLLYKVRRTFIHSYVILKSQKELFDLTKTGRKHFRTKLTGGQQEVLTIRPIDKYHVKCEVFIKIETGWNTLFERLAEENVFGWLFDKEKQYLISKSENWINVKNFDKHANTANVVYYLADTKRQLLYVGKATILGTRVKAGSKHQNMPEGWDFFRYDIIKPEYASLLERIEDHTIRVLACLLKNNRNYPSLEVSPYRLVNLNWKKL